MNLFVPRIVMGADPEIFLSKNGKIIGSERVIPGGPLVGPAQSCNPSLSMGQVVRDGIQAELHPAPTHCRQILAENTLELLKLLGTEAAKHGAKLDFSQTVTVTQKEINSLSEESRRLGCQESLNIHTPGRGLGIDPTKYQVRSAGGHMHFDLTAVLDANGQRIDVLKFVPILDILVGNTSILLDDDPRAAERRQVYGRAGEFRTPAYGLEYRTLSNFWLRSEMYLSLMFGLARQAIGLVYTDVRNGDDANQKQLLKLIKLENIIKAINEADRDLALDNLKRLKKFFHGPFGERMKIYKTGLDAGNFDKFIKWTSKGRPQLDPDPGETFSRWSPPVWVGSRPGFESIFERMEIA